MSLTFRRFIATVRAGAGPHRAPAPRLESKEISCWSFYRAVASTAPPSPAALTGVLAVGGAALSLAPAAAVTTDAIRDLDICRQHAIPANDDGSSTRLELPFPINFFGTQHESLFVNNNGNITFDRGLSQYTPEDLTGPTGNAMIAPFFADIDTRGDGSRLVTYGWDDTTFCVDWVEVGYYSAHDDKLISAQLVVTDRSAATGNAGDVRLEFNYSDVGWETGDASGGSGGMGGTSVAVGYTAGTGEPGTFQQFTGSLVNGALVDGGPNALTAGSRNSDVRGRYVFDLGGEDLVQEGVLAGTVTDEAGTPLEVEVRACPAAGGDCVTTTSGANGAYSVVGLREGDYAVTATPAIGSGLAPATQPAAITAGEETELDFVLEAAPLGSLAVTAEAWEDGSAVEGADVTVCRDGTETCVDLPATDTDGGTAIGDIEAGDYVVRVGAPADSGLQDGTARTTVVAEEESTVTVLLLPVPDHTVTGTVVDTAGAPVAGATVTLERGDDGEYVAVAEGAQWLAGDTAANPVTVGEDGAFRWTVVGGDYRVRAEAADCTPTEAVVEFDEQRYAVVTLVVDCLTPTPTDPEPSDSEPTDPEPGEEPTAAAEPTTQAGSGTLPATGAGGATAAGAAALALLTAGALLVISRRRAWLSR